MGDLYQKAQQLAMRSFTVVLTRDETTDGKIFVASHPELPGCLAQGNTPEEAVANLADARTEYILGLLEYDLPVPTPNPLSAGSATIAQRTFSFVYSSPQAITQMLSESAPGDIASGADSAASPEELPQANAQESAIAAVEWPVSRLSFKFNREKAVEAILYIASRIPDPTLHSVTKLIYFADKMSLEKYGRPISGDTYYAMKFGPVPTNTYDLMKKFFLENELGFQKVDRNIVPQRDANLDELSDSDIECLDGAIADWGSVSFGKRTEDSHDDAWQEAWNRRGDKSSVEMTFESIIELLDDLQKLLEHLRTQHDD